MSESIMPKILMPETAQATLPLNSLGLPKRPEDTRVVVAMSGGVDSSVVAGLLKQQGYETIGITLQLYNQSAGERRVGSCCAGQDIEDARLCAETLGIPYYVLDYENRFQQAVINPFAESYALGETPVPCIACNQTVKFADLLATARQLGADALATGHYIRSAPLPGRQGGRRALYRPVDDNRDQSYFLFATTQEQIDYLRFPLGGMSKPQVRKLAEEMGLVVADKHDSQDICFVPQRNYAEIITKLRPEAAKPGAIMHIDGRILGRHNGILHYTIGQRRGIGVAMGEPLYVIALNAEKCQVIVGPLEALATRKVYLRNVNWLGDTAPQDFPAEGIALYAKLRSTRPPCPAVLHYDAAFADEGKGANKSAGTNSAGKDNGSKENHSQAGVSRESDCGQNKDSRQNRFAGGSFWVELAEGESGIAPGQACALYSDAGNEARLLGGGFITRTQGTAAIEAQITRLQNTAPLQAAE